MAAVIFVAVDCSVVFVVLVFGSTILPGCARMSQNLFIFDSIIEISIQRRRVKI